MCTLAPALRNTSRRDYDKRRGSGGYYREQQHHRGGGGYHRGGGGGDRRQQQPQRYQSSYVGQKRGRDEPEALDPKKQFIKRLMKLGEPGPLAEVGGTGAGDTQQWKGR